MGRRPDAKRVRCRHRSVVRRSYRLCKYGLHHSVQIVNELSTLTTMLQTQLDKVVAVSTITTVPVLSLPGAGPFAPQSNDFTISWDAVPTQSASDVVTGLSFVVPTGFASMGCIIRFRS